MFGKLSDTVIAEISDHAALNHLIVLRTSCQHPVFLNYFQIIFSLFKTCFCTSFNHNFFLTKAGLKSWVNIIVCLNYFPNVFSLFKTCFLQTFFYKLYSQFYTTKTGLKTWVNIIVWHQIIFIFNSQQQRKTYSLFGNELCSSYSTDNSVSSIKMIFKCHAYLLIKMHCRYFALVCWQERCIFLQGRTFSSDVKWIGLFLKKSSLEALSQKYILLKEKNKLKVISPADVFAVGVVQREWVHIFTLFKK